MKTIRIILLILIIIGLVLLFTQKLWVNNLVNFILAHDSTVITPTVTDNNLTEKVNVENYLRENISKLSPVKAVLGGTWYVVSNTIDLIKNSGIVTYEDGHIQEIKNFSYTTNEKGGVESLIIK